MIDVRFWRESNRGINFVTKLTTDVKLVLISLMILSWLTSVGPVKLTEDWIPALIKTQSMSSYEFVVLNALVGKTPYKKVKTYFSTNAPIPS